MGARKIGLEKVKNVKNVEVKPANTTHFLHVQKLREEIQGN